MSSKRLVTLAVGAGSIAVLALPAAAAAADPAPTVAPSPATSSAAPDGDNAASSPSDVDPTAARADADQADTTQADPGQTDPDQTNPDQEGLDQANPDQATPTGDDGAPAATVDGTSPAGPLPTGGAATDGAPTDGAPATTLDTTPPATPSPTAAPASDEVDQAYLQAAAAGNLLEVALGQLALDKSQQPQVRALATATLTDHQAAEQALTPLLQEYGVPAPSAQDPQLQQSLAQLRALPAAAFDQGYAVAQVAAHEALIIATQAELQKGLDTDVKAFAQQLLPVLQQHLDMAQQLVALLAPTAPAQTQGEQPVAATTPSTGSTGGSQGTGTPVRVQAGTGGQMADHGRDLTTAWSLLGAGAGVVLVSGGALARRRRSAVGV